jgi:hypothetical protein
MSAAIPWQQLVQTASTQASTQANHVKSCHPKLVLSQLDCTAGLIAFKSVVYHISSAADCTALDLPAHLVRHVVLATLHTPSRRGLQQGSACEKPKCSQCISKLWCTNTVEVLQ